MAVIRRSIFRPASKNKNNQVKVECIFSCRLIRRSNFRPTSKKKNNQTKVEFIFDCKVIHRCNFGPKSRNKNNQTENTKETKIFSCVPFCSLTSYFLFFVQFGFALCTVCLLKSCVYRNICTVDCSNPIWYSTASLSNTAS